MLQTILKRLGSGFLVIAMIFTMSIPQDFSYGATVPSDVKGHWAESYITKAINDGVINGYPNGGFKPDNPVSRVEFIHMINAVLGNNGTTSINFNDTVRSEWYYTDVSKAVAAGYVSGYSDNSFKPNNTITREEATVMLARILPTYGKSSSLSKFSDASKVSDWAAESFQRIYGKGYIGAYDDAKLHPQDKMTRAQAAKIICDISDKETIVKTDPNVSSTGTTLSNRIFSNGVTITRSLDEGSAYLSNCVILGTLNIQGGGENSVEINNTRVMNATVAKSSGRVRVSAKGESNIETLTASNEATLQTSSLTNGTFGSGFKKINMVRDSNVVFTGNFDAINITGTSAEATFTAGTVSQLTIEANASDADITVETSATITNAKVNSNAKFHGNGTIRTMEVNADDVSYSKKPDHVIIGKNVSDQPNESESTNGDITISPANKATSVSKSTDITLTFRTAMTLYNGKAITSSNIDDFVDLRKGSSSGSRVSFDAEISSSKKVITITPDSKLDDDTRYYVSIDRNELKDSSDDGNDSFSSYFSTGDDEDSSTIGDVTVSPANKATGVSRTTKISLTFKYAMKLYDGKAITSSNIDDFLELREGSANGSRVNFDATINSAKKIITIEPDSKLDDDTRYYISIDRNELKDTYNDGNPSFSSYFNTGDQDSSSTIGDVTISPANRRTDVAINTDITLKFKYAMKLYDGKTITSSNIDDFVELRKGSSSGSSVSFDATIDSAKKLITITPDRDLSDDTKYYVIIDRNELKDSNNDGNPSFSSYFTTGDDEDSDYITFSPRKGTTDVSVDVEPSIRFSEKMLTYNGNTLTSSNLSDIITFRRDSSTGTRVSYEVSMNSDRTRIDIEPTSKLAQNTKYYLAINERALKTANKGTIVPSASVTWTTTSNSDPKLVSLGASAASDTSVSVSAEANVTGTFYAVIIPQSATVPSADQVYNGRDANGNSVSRLVSSLGPNYVKVGTLTGLSAGTAYKVCAIQQVSNTNSSVYTTNVTTTSTNTPLISTISASPSGDSKINVTVTGNKAGTVYAVANNKGVVPSAAQIKVAANRKGTISSANAPLSFSFEGLDSGSTYRIYAVLEASSITSPVKDTSATTAAPAIPDAVLTGLTVDGNSISIGSDTTISAEVDYRDGMGSSVDVTARGETVKFEGGSLKEGSDTKAVTLNSSGIGSTKVEIGGDGKKKTTYTINIKVKGGDTNATINVAGATENGDTYTLGTFKDSVRVSVTPRNSNATATINGANSPTAVLLDTATTTVTIVVSNNGLTDTRTITIVRPDPPTNP